jgi:tetratricopeptide (TPR) repeat protein
MKGPGEAAWMDRLEAEHDNLRAALDRELPGGAIAAAAGACEVLRWFWYIRGHIGEGRLRLEQALRAVEAHGVAIPPGRRGKLLQGAGIFADEQGDYAQAAARYAGALAVYQAQGDTRGVQATTNSLGMLAWARGEYERARACFEESLRLCRETGNTYGVANSLNSLGTAIQAQGDLAGALACLAEALEVARAVGYEQLVTMVLDNIGDVSLALGDQERAAGAYAEALAVQRAQGDARGAAISLQGLGLVALARGELGPAAAQLYEALGIARRAASRRELATHADNVAALLAAQGRAAEAARLCGASSAARERTGAALTALERESFERTLAAARASLGQAAFQGAYAAGAAAGLDQVVGEALERNAEG